MILYADILFLIDFSMDVISLWITGRLTSTRLTVIRTCIAAALSALTSVIITALGTSENINMVITVAVSCVMCLIAFKRAPFTAFIKRFLILWLGGILLGGLMTWLTSIGNTGGRYYDFGRHGPAFSAIPAALVLLIILLRAISVPRNIKNAELTVAFRDNSVRLAAFCDTGNLLEDPFTGESVIFVRSCKLKTLFTDDEYAYLAEDSVNVPRSLAKNIRVIPSKSVSGEKLLRAIRMKVVLNGKKDCRAVVSLTDNIGDIGCDALISPKLL